mmetsp:Transcript_84999/g.214183  ORF Transcript_84999/g.214183 Transcript_84999/m.214183 type:complete len:92 (+) Transcript_84999:179-454(+)
MGQRCGNSTHASRTLRTLRTVAAQVSQPAQGRSEGSKPTDESISLIKPRQREKLTGETRQLKKKWPSSGNETRRQSLPHCSILSLKTSASA